MPYISLLNIFKFHFPREISKTTISTAKKDPSGDETSGKSGLSHPHAVQKGGRGREDIEPRELSDLPIDLIPDLVQKRKDDFGIWISQEAIRHFESLTCNFDVNDPVFQKIENYFRPVYGSNSWATPIDNGKKEELGICFGVQFTRKGFLKVHLSDNKDAEVFIKQFFELFSQFLTDEDIIKFLEMLTLSRSHKPVFFIHEARNIGPKKVIDEDFKGAHIKVNEVHWFGEIKWDARIDYSKPFAPHIEGHGPMPQVGNFMKLIDGSPEFIANLSEVRELEYRIRDKVHDNYNGIGELSSFVLDHGRTLQLVNKNILNTYKDTLSYISEVDARLFGLDILIDSNQVVTNKHLINIHKLHNKEIEELVNMNNNICQTVAEESIDIQETMKERAEVIIEGQDEILAAQGKNHHELKQKLEIIDGKFDSLEKSIKGAIKEEFESFGNKFKNNLKLVIRQLHLLPGRTAHEISEVLNCSKSAVYSYLKKLQDHNLIESYKIPTGQKGRPKGFYMVSDKFKNLIKNRRKNNKKGE